ncbi:hypothetical protein [Spirosoma sp. KUDC1026]|uniref:hypothetical protein n=1 Tax=Spirosoma sp. KUDC1026 TaxID=2745947 RepID=UPI00159BCFE5|nr:hypothetical protein [Spirosoma sp. KUDC1026]QKZ13730.1 hypothetical protein HU175_14245 [Spirosoma sp. KUDC1026]
MNIDSSAIANFISGISLTVSTVTLYFFIRDRSKQKYAIANEYTKQLLEWHSMTVEVLIKLRSCSAENKEDLLSRLSTQIEKGRFYFPNINKDDGFGLEKPTAYQGYRNLTLDFLVYSYNLFNKKNCQDFHDHAVILQREFTSNIFQILRPKELLNEIKFLTDKFYASNEIFEDFLSKEANAQIFTHHKS